MKKRSYFSLCILVLVLLFLYAPIFVMTLNSFNLSRLGGQWEGWTLKWYRALWNDSELLGALKNTLLVAIATMVTSTFLGSLAAFCLRFYRSKLQSLLSVFIYTPLIVPEVHMGISLMLLFVFLQIPLGLGTIFIAHSTFCISYVTLIMLSNLEEFDISSIEAASDLGATWSTIACKIMLPLLRQGLLASSLLAFTLSLDDFVITFFVAGPGAVTLPLHIYSMTKFGSPASINALSTLLLILAIMAAWTSRKLFIPSTPKSRGN